MVSSILPGATSAAALGVDPRFSRQSAAQSQTRSQASEGDRVELSPAALSATRDSVRAGIAQVQETLALGHDAQSMLVQVQAMAREGGVSQSDLDALLQSYAQRADGAVSRGVSLASGEDLSIQAEPGAGGVTIAGVDLRLKANPSDSDIIAVPADASADDPSLAATAQKSLDALQTAMNRLMDSARSLEAHQGFLGAAEGAGNVHDLDADSARLMALQVRQGLQAAGVSAIANVEPQSVLALFKA
jgi:hypothetical protein